MAIQVTRFFSMWFLPLGISEISSLQSSSTPHSSGVETSNSTRNETNFCVEASKSNGWLSQGTYRVPRAEWWLSEWCYFRKVGLLCSVCKIVKWLKLKLKNSKCFYTEWHKKNGNFWKTQQKFKKSKKKKLLTEIELRRILQSMQHSQGDTKERELLKCVVAVKEYIRGGGRHLQNVIFKQW